MDSLQNVNIEQFYFLCTGSSGAQFSVREFSGSEAVSHPATFTITVSSPSERIDPADLVNTPALFLIHRKGEFHPFPGIITEARSCSTDQFHSLYKVTLESGLRVLGYTSRCRIFQKKNVPDIVAAVLDDNGITDYEMACTLTYPEKEYVVQFNESDFDFIHRLIEEAGIWYFLKTSPVLLEEIDASGIIEPIVFTDDPSRFADLPSDPALPFRYPSGMVQDIDMSGHDCIFECSYMQTMIPEKVTVKSHNYRTPEVDLKDYRPVEGGHYGLHYEYGGDFRTAGEAAAAAEIEAKRCALDAVRITGKSYHRGLRAGYRISITGHEREELCSTFLLTEVIHTGKAAGKDTAFTMPSYHNEFIAVPDSTANRYVPQKKTAAGNIPGLLNAFADATGETYATLDDKGRYKIRLPFDLEERESCTGSKPIRMAQTYSGAGYGMHFPLHKKTELLLGHVAGDIDKPIGIVSVPDANTVSPVSSNNKESSVLRTAGKNELTLNDTEGQEQMSFSAPCTLSLVADGAQTIAIGNNRSVSVKKNETKEVSGSQTLEVTVDCTESVGANNKDTVAGNSDQTVSGNVEATFQNTADRTTGGDWGETVSGGKGTEITASNNETYSGDHSIEASGDLYHSAKAMLTLKTSGNMSITAGETAGAQSLAVTIQGTASVTLKVGGNTIELTPAGIEINSANTVTIGGSLVTTTGGIISISGLPVNIN